DGRAGLAIPDERRFALVGDADGGDVGASYTRRLQGLADRGHDAVPDLVRVVLDPPRLGEVLREFAVRPPDRGAVRGHHERRRPRRALIDRQNVPGLPRHGPSRLSKREERSEGIETRGWPPPCERRARRT